MWCACTVGTWDFAGHAFKTPFLLVEYAKDFLKNLHLPMLIAQDFKV